MANQYISDVLYHFVGFRHPSDNEVNYDLLQKILNAGSIRHHETLPGWRIVEYKWSDALSEGALLVPQVTCFCDIPYQGLEIHKKKYGSFGIGLSRKFLVRSGARPVMYFPVPLEETDELLYGRPFLKKWIDMRAGFDHILVTPNTGGGMRTLFQEPSDEREAVFAADDLITEFFAYLKAFNPDLEDDNPENFYMEREWRKRGHLKFTDDDIQQVVIDLSYADRFAFDFPQLVKKVICEP
jgi:hypothetical protein